MSRIIAVANQKGGVGKTTTSVNLASCIASNGYKALLVDIDPQGNATSGVGMSESEGASLYEVLLGEAEPGDTIRHTEYKGLDIIPTAIELAGAEIELVALDNRELLLKRSLAKIRGGYDYIIIDCPPSLSLLTVNALTAADSVLIPIQCEYYALEGLGQLMNTIRLMRKKLNPSLSIEGILLTMFDARTNLCAQVVHEVRTHFENEVFETMVPRNIRLSEAPSYGQPINIYDPRCAGAKAYMELAEELIERRKSVKNG